MEGLGQRDTHGVSAHEQQGQASFTRPKGTKHVVGVAMAGLGSRSSLKASTDSEAGRPAVASRRRWQADRQAGKAGTKVNRAQTREAGLRVVKHRTTATGTWLQQQQRRLSLLSTTVSTPLPLLSRRARLLPHRKHAALHASLYFKSEGKSLRAAKEKTEKRTNKLGCKIRRATQTRKRKNT